MSTEEEKGADKDMIATIISGLFQIGITIWKEVAARKNATEEQRKQNEERSRAAFERMRNAVLSFEDQLDENDRTADAILAGVLKSAEKVMEKVGAPPAAVKFDTSDS